MKEDQMAGPLVTSGKAAATWPKDALRITFGVIWLIDAILKWLPGFRSGYLGMISDAGQGQPGWLHWWFSFWLNLQRPEVAFFAYSVAAAETLIAVAVIAGFARKMTYIAAATLSVLIWAVAEGFGGPYTSGASDIGTAIIYAVVFVGLLALMAYSGPARYSADYYLEKKISWWWRIAEIRRPVPEQATPAAVVLPQQAARTPAFQSATPGPAGLLNPADLTAPAGPAAPARNGVHPGPVPR
jgi:nitrite reductase (NO-forming)